MSEPAIKIRPELTALLLKREDPLSWGLMPDYFARVVKFCATYDPEENPDVLIKNIMEDFTNDQHVYCLPVILKDNRMVGHGLFKIRVYGTKRLALLTQAAFDKGEGVEAEGINGLVESLELWAHQNGCTAMEAWVDDQEVRERALRIFHHFQRYKIVMRKVI